MRPGRAQPQPLRPLARVEGPQEAEYPVCVTTHPKTRAAPHGAAPGLCVAVRPSAVR